MSDAFQRYVELLDALGSLRRKGASVEAEVDLLDELDLTWNDMNAAQRESAWQERWRAPTRGELEATRAMDEAERSALRWNEVGRATVEER